MDERSAALGSLTSVAIAAGLCLCVWSLGGVARAQVPLDALVVLPACPDGFADLRLRRLLILELSDAGVASLEVHAADEPALPDAAITVTLEASCEEEGRSVVLAVRGAGDEPRVRQQLELSEVDASSRPRAIAVAAAEQVRLQRLLAEQAPAPWQGRNEPPAPEPRSDAPPTVRSGVDVEVPERPDAPAEQTEGPGVPVAGALHASFEARGFPESATWPVGARLGAWLRILEVLRLGFDVGPAFASAEHPAGRVETWLVTVGFSAGARWAVTEQLGITPAARLDVGYASFSGFSGSAGSTRGDGLALALFGSLGFDIALAAQVGLLIEIDVGSSLVAHVALAGDERVAGTSGVALAFRLGFSFGL